MSNGTTQASGSVVSYSVKVEGKTIPGSYQLLSMTVEKRVNRISTARIRFLDGSASKATFAVSSSDSFVPGKSIQIEAGYNSQDTPIFKGIVTGQSLRVDPVLGSTLEVECRDEAVKMTIGRKSASFSQVTDSAAIEQLIGNYSGLSAEVTSTATTVSELVQYYTSDWDFLLTRAEVNSLLVTTLNGRVSVFNPISDTSSALTVTYGQDLFGFNADLNAVTQLGEVKASAWDYQSQQRVDGQASSTQAGPGNLSAKTLSEVIGLNAFELQTSGAESTDELTDWAKAQMLKSGLAKIRGDAHFQGSAALDPGQYLTLKGLGDRFNGDHFVSGVMHEIGDGNWLTTASLGLPPSWFVQEPDVMAPAAAGLLPGVQGLFNATVKQVYDDPDNEYRILVDLPLFQSDGQGQWARLANFYSSSGAGVFFLPEVGDEVIVGFVNQDPRYPIVLGSLYSSGREPWSELSPNENNSQKAIVTRSQLRVLFNDENKVLTLATPGGNTVTLDDQNKQIGLSDENGNSVTLSDSGISLSSPKSISIEADQNVTIKGQTGVSVQASGGDVSIEGLNIKESADVEYSAEGSATASVKGGGELTLKAAMVMIN